MKRWRIKEPIAFTDEDTQGVRFSHNDMVVISLNIANYDVHRILVDNESFIDVLYYDAFFKMSISDNHLGPMSSPLVGFTGDTVLVEGMITLAVTAGQYPK